MRCKGLVEVSSQMLLNGRQEEFVDVCAFSRSEGADSIGSVVVGGVVFVPLTALTLFFVPYSRHQRWAYNGE